MVENLLFVVLVLGALGGSQLWLRRVARDGRWPWLLCASLVGILIGGYLLADAAASREWARLQHMVAGMAPTYAREMERLGHAQLPADPDPQDPRYLALIDAQLRWLAANQTIDDIYTVRQSPDGQHFYFVDSETDYDRDGRFEGERESRTESGEAFEADDPDLVRAFAGEANFSAVATPDRWGTWITAWEPMYDEQGRVEGVLGVDYDAREWVAAAARARATVLGGLLLLALLLIGARTMVTMLRADLAARRRAEAQVRGLNAELEQRVAERTVELKATNEDLREQIAERERTQAENERMHLALLETSRQAGMAEIATGVLHNVGNVLNSVNVSSRLVADAVRTSRLASLAKLAALLREHEDDLATFLTTDPKGRQVPSYLLKLADHLAREQDFLAQELEALRKHVEHIRQVVNLQQDTARLKSVMEALSARELVEDALQISGASLARHRIEVVREFTPVPAVIGDRHRVIQVLVNLIRNAKQALDARANGRRMVLRIDGDGNGHVLIAVRDNGSGIDADTLPRLFSHGFTTKAGGHGFGLHNSCLSMKQMGGSLTAHSDGRDQGAAFTIELPAEPVQGGSDTARPADAARAADRVSA